MTDVQDMATDGSTRTRPRADNENATERAPAASAKKVRRVKRRPVKKSFVWLHRWTSLVLGLFLILETTSGAALLYSPELNRHLYADSYVQGISNDTPKQISFQDAIDAAVAIHPDFTPGVVYDSGGTVLASDYDTGQVVTVDPSTGEVVGGWTGDERPGALGWALALAEQIHLCAMSCEEDPLYLGFMAKEIPHTSWLGFDANLNGAGLVLGLLAVLLLFLSLSGIWLWWPTIKHFHRGVRVRFKANRYARDYDLHQVVGMIGVPLLLIWGLTGMSYEYGWFTTAYSAVTPGSDYTADFTSGETGTEIGYDAAVAAAQQAVGTTEDPVYYEVPAADDPAASYGIWFSDGFDPWRGGGEGGGDLQVFVDRHDASHTAVGWGSSQESIAQKVNQDYNYSVHAGIIANVWLRAIWLVLGLTPLVLAWTGVSTWLFKRTVRKRRQKARAAAAAV